MSPIPLGPTCFRDAAYPTQYVRTWHTLWERVRVWGWGRAYGHKGRGVLGCSQPFLPSLCLQLVGSVRCGLNGTCPAGLCIGFLTQAHCIRLLSWFFVCQETAVVHKAVWHTCLPELGNGVATYGCVACLFWLRWKQ